LLTLVLLSGGTNQRGKESLEPKKENEMMIIGNGRRISRGERKA
jgi:hypothetical protein